MIFITKETELDTKNGLSIIYFYAPWFLFHKKISEHCAALENTYKDIKFYGVDIEQFKGLVTRFNILSLPTILVVRDEGRLIKNIIGIKAVFDAESAIHDIYESYTKKYVGDEDVKASKENEKC